MASSRDAVRVFLVEHLTRVGHRGLVHAPGAGLGLVLAQADGSEVAVITHGDEVELLFRDAEAGVDGHTLSSRDARRLAWWLAWWWCWHCWVGLRLALWRWAIRPR